MPKLFECLLCNSKFIKKEFNNHIKKKCNKIADDIIDYKCYNCFTIFNEKNELDNHKCNNLKESNDITDLRYVIYEQGKEIDNLIKLINKLNDNICMKNIELEQVRNMLIKCTS